MSQTKEVESVPVGPSAPQPKKGVKRPASSKPTSTSHPSCEKCKLKPKGSTGEPSPWQKHVRKWIIDHPDQSDFDARLNARKHYVPPSGRPKSFERIYTEIWHSRNPAAKLSKKDPEAIKGEIRESYLAEDF